MESFLSDLGPQLLDRSFRATLHRLRGVRNLLSGWATLGPTENEMPKVSERLEEDRLLLGRLDWIHPYLNQPLLLEFLRKGEAPGVLFAAAMGWGTPEEAGQRMPDCQNKTSLLGWAFWVHLAHPTQEVTHPDGAVQLEWVQGQAKFRFPSSTINPSPPPEWKSAFGSLCRWRQHENGFFCLGGNLQSGKDKDSRGRSVPVPSNC